MQIYRDNNIFEFAMMIADLRLKKDNLESLQKELADEINKLPQQLRSFVN